MNFGIEHESAPLRAVLMVAPTGLDEFVAAQHGAVPATWSRLPEPGRVRAQWETLRAALVGWGVKVHVVPGARAEHDSIFARDVGRVIGDELVLTRSAVPHRSGEVDAVALELATERLRWLEAPAEGADVLLVQGVHVVGTGTRTTEAAAAELAALYPGLRWHHLPRRGPPVPQHLLGGHRILGDVLFQRADVEPLPWRGDVEVLQPDAEVVQRLAMNWLELDERTVIAPAGCPGVHQRLRARGVQVHELPMDALTCMDGGFACATLPLVRRW